MAPGGEESMSSYNWNADEYARHSKAQQVWARELIAKLDLQGSENILDIGCGDGKVTAEIAQAIPNGSILGVDNSSSMIELAQNKYPPDHYPNLNFQFADARALPFSREFEIVFSNAALHWVRDHRPVLAGVYRSLRPNGRILLQMGGRGNASDILSILDDMISKSIWAGYFNGFDFPYGFHDAADYKKWLEKTGFHSIRADLIPKAMAHDGPDDLTGWFKTTWLPYTQRIPESQREEFVGELVEKYLHKYPADRNGTIHVKMVRLEIEAIKST
jgi:trans-aconitate methyltransferase